MQSLVLIFLRKYLSFFFPYADFILTQIPAVTMYHINNLMCREDLKWEVSPVWWGLAEPNSASFTGEAENLYLPEALNGKGRENPKDKREMHV